ncbi:MAG: phage holin family protein [Actinomycetota bacterium]
MDEPELPLGELVGRLTNDFGELVQSHIKLAKEEITTEVKQAGRAAGLLGGSALAGWIALLILSFALAWGLAAWWDSPGLGFLAVGAIWTAVAAALWVRGRHEMQDFEPMPQETIEELEEDKRWLSEQKS